MGSSQSIEIPGGGTEGYHILRVKKKSSIRAYLMFLDTSSNFSIGARRLAGS